MPPVELTDERLVAYLAGAVSRASAVYISRPTTDPQHALALGEAVALFNLADEFGLIERLRQVVDARAGHDVYGRLSEAMKAYYLGLPASGAALPGGGPPTASRPTAGRPGGQPAGGPRPGGPPRGGPPGGVRPRPPAPPPRSGLGRRTP